jgi:pSer/pThr/pTyr-binding forkhead associated (FHA) protein
VKHEGGGVYKHFLSDNNSKNKTLYNNTCLENGEVVVLKDNDEIVIGKTILRFNE